MTNRIIDVAVINHRLDPHETELRVHVEVENLTPTTEIRGRLTGPRCIYSSTIEIAYPLREVQREGKHVEMRVVIPEASWWEPETPFLYQGSLELWDSGTMVVRWPISHGIRALQLTSKGLKLNGQDCMLRGKTVAPTIAEAELRSLHDFGLNVIMTSFRTEQDWDRNIMLWHWADRVGLFVLCRGLADFDARQFETIQDVFASALGCVVPPQFLPVQYSGKRLMFGVESSQLPVPDSASFTLCTTAELASVHQPTTPTIVLTGNRGESLPTRSDVIGWIESAS